MCSDSSAPLPSGFISLHSLSTPDPPLLWGLKSGASARLCQVVPGIYLRLLRALEVFLICNLLQSFSQTPQRRAPLPHQPEQLGPRLTRNVLLVNSVVSQPRTLTLASSCRLSTSPVSTLNPTRSCCGRCGRHSPLCWMRPTPSERKYQKERSCQSLELGASQPCSVRLLSGYLRVMGAHRSVAPQRASGVAVAGVGEGVVLDLVVPRLHQLQDGAIPAKRINTTQSVFLIRLRAFLS